jgi:hypothetical protein
LLSEQLARGLREILTATRDLLWFERQSTRSQYNETGPFMRFGEVKQDLLRAKSLKNYQNRVQEFFSPVECVWAVLTLDATSAFLRVVRGINTSRELVAKGR